MLFANNFFAQNKTTELTNEPVVIIGERYGIRTGNVFSSVTSNKTPQSKLPSLFAFLLDST